MVGRQHLSTSEQRLRGYRLSLQAAGLKVNRALEFEAESRIDTAYKVAQQLLSMPEPPSAIFAANNLMMLGAIEAILDMGFKCPEEISLAGVDDFAQRLVAEGTVFHWSGAFGIGILTTEHRGLLA